MNDLNELKNNLTNKNYDNNSHLTEKECMNIITDDERNHKEEKNYISISEASSLNFISCVSDCKSSIDKENSFYSEDSSIIKNNRTYNSRNGNISSSNTDGELIFPTKFEDSTFFNEVHNSDIKEFENYLKSNEKIEEVHNYKCSDKIMNTDQLIPCNKNSEKQKNFQITNVTENTDVAINENIQNNFKNKVKNSVENCTKNSTKSSTKNGIENSIKNSIENSTENNNESIFEKNTLKGVADSVQNINNTHFNYRNKNVNNQNYSKIKHMKSSDFDPWFIKKKRKDYNIKYNKILNSMIDSILSYPYFSFYETNYMKEQNEKNYICDKDVKKSDPINNNIPFNIVPINKDKTVFDIHKNNIIKNNKNIFNKYNTDNSRSLNLSHYNRENPNIYSYNDKMSHLNNNNMLDYSSSYSKNLQQKLKSDNEISNFCTNNIFKNNNKSDNLNYGEQTYLPAFINYNIRNNKYNMNNVKDNLNGILYNGSFLRNELFFNEHIINDTNNILNNEQYNMQYVYSNCFNNNYSYNKHIYSNYKKNFNNYKKDANMINSCINNINNNNINNNNSNNINTFNNSSIVFKVNDNYNFSSNKNNKCNNIKSASSVTHNYYKDSYNTNSKRKTCSNNEENDHFNIKKIKNRIQELQIEIKDNLNDLSNNNIKEKKKLNNNDNNNNIKLKFPYKCKTRKKNVHNEVENKNSQLDHNQNLSSLNYLNEIDQKISLNKINDNNLIKCISKQFCSSFNNSNGLLCLSIMEDKEIFENLFFIYSKLFYSERNVNLNIRNMFKERAPYYFYFTLTMKDRNNYKIIKKEKMYFYYKLKELIKNQYKMNILYEFLKNLDICVIENKGEKKIGAQKINNSNSEEFDLYTEKDLKKSNVLYENYLAFLKKFYIDDIDYEELYLKELKYIMCSKEKGICNLLNSYSETGNSIDNCSGTKRNKFENVINYNKKNYNNNGNAVVKCNNRINLSNEYNFLLKEDTYNFNNNKEINFYKNMEGIKELGTAIKSEKGYFYMDIKRKNEMSKTQFAQGKCINTISENLDDKREILIKKKIKEFYKYKKKLKKILSIKESKVDNSKKQNMYKIRKIMKNLCKLSSIKFKTFLIHELFRTFFKFKKDKKKVNQNRVENLERKPLKIILNRKINTFKNEKIKDHFNSDKSFNSLTKKEDTLETTRKKIKKETVEGKEKKKQKVEKIEERKEEKKEYEEKKFEKEEDENKNYAEETQKNKNRNIKKEKIDFSSKSIYFLDDAKSQNKHIKKRRITNEIEYFTSARKLDENEEKEGNTCSEKKRCKYNELNKLSDIVSETSEKNKEIYIYIKGNLDVYLNEKMNIKFKKCNIFFKKTNVNSDFKMNFDKNFSRIFFNKILVDCIKDVQVRKNYFSSSDETSDSNNSHSSDDEKENKIRVKRNCKKDHCIKYPRKLFPSKESCTYKVNSLKRDEIILLFQILYRNFYKCMPKLAFNYSIGVYYKFSMFSKKNKDIYNIKKSIIYEKLDDVFYFNFFLSKYINLKEGELYSPQHFFSFDRNMILSIILYLNKNLGELSILHKLYEEYENMEYIKNYNFYNKNYDNEIINHEDRYFNIIKNYLNNVIIPYCDHSNF